MKTVKLVTYNGFYAAATPYSRRLFRQANLKVYNHYLSLSALESHFKSYDMKIEVI